MNFKKNSLAYSAMVLLAVFAVAGWSLALSRGNNVSAQDSGTIDGATVEELYDAVFHRPADAGGLAFHRNRKLKDILRDFRGSEEMRYYGALFKSVKAYEEAQRVPGTLSDAEKQSHLDLIDSALSNLLAWVATLPDQDACRATVGPDHAREAVKAAYDRLDAAGKASADHGLLNALRRIGPPSGITIHPKCMTPSPSASPTASPTVSPTPTPTATLSPTPTP